MDKNKTEKVEALKSALYYKQKLEFLDAQVETDRENAREMFRLFTLDETPSKTKTIIKKNLKYLQKEIVKNTDHIRSLLDELSIYEYRYGIDVKSLSVKDLYENIHS